MSRMTLRWQLLLPAVLLMVWVQAAASQPIEPALALQRIERAYRRGPIAERVRVTIERIDEVHEGAFIVRVDAARAGHPAAVRLEMGPLRVSAIGDGITGRIVAEHVQDETAFAAWSFDGPLTPAVLERFIPPLPAPQLALALGQPGSDLTSYTPSIVWAAATRELDHGRSVLRLTGRSRAKPVTLIADAVTGRLIELTAMIGNDDPPTRLTIRCEPIEAGEPVLWTIPTAGRHQLASLQSLRPRPAQIRPGDIFPVPMLLDEAAQPWSIDRALHDTPQGGRRPEVRLAALVFFRASDASDLDTALADAHAGLDAIDLVQVEMTARANAVIEQGGRARLLRLVARPVALLSLSNARAQRRAVYARATGAWSEPRSKSLLWSPSSGLTLDRIAPGSRVVLAVVDATGKLRAVVALDDRAGDADAIARGLIEQADREAWSLPDPSSIDPMQADQPPSDP